nr:hypothetical protein Iba_chr05cCG9860 [Ipomoea batatas]
MEMLQLLYDNCSTLRAANLARRYGKIDIYADHGIQEAELVHNLFLPSSAPECDDGVITQPEKEVAAECENNCEADDEPIDDSDAEDSCDPFLSDDDDEVRAARKFGTQQAEEDIDGARNSPNDEDIHGAENTDNEEGMQQNGGDNGGCEDMDQAAFGEDYDSDDPPSYHTDNEDNLNDVGDHSKELLILTDAHTLVALDLSLGIVNSKVALEIVNKKSEQLSLSARGTVKWKGGAVADCEMKAGRA